MDTKLATLSPKEINMFLSDDRALVGRLATINNDGYPYIVPVHFVYLEGKIYIHGSTKGSKIDNIARNSKVSFEVEFMDQIIPAQMPCYANTTFTSVIITGQAGLTKDEELKQTVLNLFVDKYLPNGDYDAMPAKFVNMTGVIEIVPDSMSAKSRVTA